MMCPTEGVGNGSNCNSDQNRKLAKESTANVSWEGAFIYSLWMEPTESIKRIKTLFLLGY